MLAHFLEQVERCPGEVAVVWGRQRITYRDLYGRAGRLAGRLRALGVGPETLVGMAFERSAEAIMCTVGIVLAGGAYVPVNPRFPGARIARILGDARPPVLVVGPGVADTVGLAAPADTRVYDYADLSSVDSVVPEPPADCASRLAYVMYTSGSTGRPKGVMVEHAGVVRLVKGADYFDVDADQRILMTGALEFDAATFEIWGALLNGGTLVVVDQETLVTPWRLRRAVREHGVSVMWLTAALFNQLVDEDVKVFAGLRTLLVGGDVLSCRHVNLVREAYPNLVLINGYGPTENTTFTTTHRIDRRYETAIPIGRPIRGTTVLVRDDRRRPVPVGVVGELYVGGAGLARGYLHDPELTAERFVHVDGERWYRTGDLVSSDADGVLHFHGRKDDQVKIRGHRVELGEARAALLEVAGVTDAYLVVTEPAPNDKCLIAYVVTGPGVAVTDIRRDLRRRCPAYLCPDQVVAVDRLPLNANAKVDRGRLPAPPRPPEARRTEEQERLAQVWAEVLHVEADTIAPDDDFFDLGGNSLSAGALLGRLGRTLGVEEVFATRTLAAMADVVARARPARRAPIPAAPPGASIPLHPQQRALYALWRLDESSLVYNVPFVIQTTCRLDPHRVRAALAELIARHDALRTRFPDGVHQVVETDAPVRLEVAEVDTDADAVARLVRPFRLDELPLIRGLLTGDRLYLDVHHVVFDAVSLRIVVDELLDLLAGVRLPQPRIRYADAALVLRAARRRAVPRG